MVETKQVKIGDKEYWMRCSLLTTESFERTTGKKFSDVVVMYKNLGKDPENIVEHIIDIEVNAVQLAYCMIKEAQRKGLNEGFNESMEEFMDDVGSLNSEELKGVLALSMSVFPRKVQNRTGADEADK